MWDKVKSFNIGVAIFAGLTFVFVAVALFAGLQLLGVTQFPNQVNGYLGGGLIGYAFIVGLWITYQGSKQYNEKG